MRKFSDFNIKTEVSCFVGDKIKISKVLNRPIVIHASKIVNSEYTGKRVDMQIEMSGVKYLLWSGSKVLIDMISKVPDECYPFETTIVEEDKMFIFT